MALQGNILQLNPENEKIPPEGEISTWCYAVDILLTKSIELVDDYALRELVQEFSLSPDLVTA